MAMFAFNNDENEVRQPKLVDNDNLNNGNIQYWASYLFIYLPIRFVMGKCRWLYQRGKAQGLRMKSL